MMATAAVPNSCISRSAVIAPGSPNRLWTGAEVAWVRLGSCTDQVASARPAVAANAISAKPAPSRRRRPISPRQSSDRKAAKSNVRLKAYMSIPSTEHGDEPEQRRGRRILVVHHRHADISGPGVAPVGLLACQVATGNHAQSGFAPQLHRGGFV